MATKSEFDNVRRRMKKNDVPLEKKIEAAVCQRAVMLGFEQRKFTSPNHISAPDRIFFKWGLCFMIEFKREGRMPTDAQTREAHKYRHCGIMVYLIDNIEGGYALIDSLSDGRVLLAHLQNHWQHAHQSDAGPDAQLPGPGNEPRH